MAARFTISSCDNSVNHSKVTLPSKGRYASRATSDQYRSSGDPRSALFYASVRVDAVGIPNEHDRVLKRLRESANAPIFSYLDNHFGQRIVGGPLLSTEEIGRKAAGGRRPHPERREYRQYQDTACKSRSASVRLARTSALEHQ